MNFIKTKDEVKNLEILKSEIKKLKSPYSKILVESLFSTSDVDDFRILIKEKVSKFIESKIEE